MKHIDVQQGTHEWLMARLGKPTASHASEILTPKELKLSKQSRAYRHRLVAEIFLGEPIESATTQFMERGNTLEPEARKWYEMETGQDVETAGLILTDDERVGCSPDGLVGENGIVEFKTYEAVHHVRELLDPKPLDNAHKGQIQWTLWVTDRGWCDRVYYHPTFQPVRVRIERDETYIGALGVALYGPDDLPIIGGFLGDLDVDIQRMKKMGHVIPEPKERVDVSAGDYTPDKGPSFDDVKEAQERFAVESSS